LSHFFIVFFTARPPCRFHAQFVEIRRLREEYYSMKFEEAQEFLIRKLRDYSDPADGKIRFYYEKVRGPNSDFAGPSGAIGPCLTQP
jgi:hypothetical protein